MREFKFRAWHKEKKIMMQAKIGFQFEETSQADICGNDIPIYTSEKDFYVECGGGCVCPPYIKSLDEIILMQFTGMKDRTGQQIYEEDIVELQENGRKRIIRIFYHPELTMNGGYMGHYLDHRPYYFFHIMEISLRRSKIIGNKYENPELMEKIDE